MSRESELDARAKELLARLVHNEDGWSQEEKNEYDNIVRERTNLMIPNRTIKRRG